MKKLAFIACMIIPMSANNPGGDTITAAAIEELTGIDLPHYLKQLLAPHNHALLLECSQKLRYGPIPISLANKVLTLLKAGTPDTTCDHQTSTTHCCSTMNTCTTFARSCAPTDPQGQPLVEWLKNNLG